MAGTMAAAKTIVNRKSILSADDKFARAFSMPAYV